MTSSTCNMLHMFSQTDYFAIRQAIAMQSLCYMTASVVLDRLQHIGFIWAIQISRNAYAKFKNQYLELLKYFFLYIKIVIGHLSDIQTHANNEQIYLQILFLLLAESCRKPLHNDNVKGGKDLNVILKHGRPI